MRGGTVTDLLTAAIVRQHDITYASQSAVAMLDGRPVLATAREDSTIVIHDIDTGRRLGAPITGHAGELTELAVAYLGNRPILVSGAEDNTIRVWDLARRATG